jgi:hypothetical protein
MIPGTVRPDATALARAARLMTRARDAFYDRRYEEAVERCQETLCALLPEPAHAETPGATPTPQEQADCFLAAFAGYLPLLEAEKIADVFTFFVRRKEKFVYQRGRPLPRRDWYEFLQITREEASEVLTASRHALEAIQRGGPPAP